MKYALANLYDLAKIATQQKYQNEKIIHLVLIKCCEYELLLKVVINVIKMYILIVSNKF